MPKILSIRSFPRAIMHMDGDAFFVGVEVAKNPSLRGKAVVTGEERGIVSALSYEAKALGVSRGLPIFMLKKNFPSVIVLPGDYESYAIYSQKMFDIVRRYCDAVEEYSIDECFADLTGWRRPLKMTYRQILEHIRDDISGELDISVSLGLAPTKVLAKVASKFVKPNGLTLIPGNRAHEFLVQTPIGKIWGIGPNSARFLASKGIVNAYDLAEKDERWAEHFLDKSLRHIWMELNCKLVSEIDPKAKETYSSIQKTRTFSPVTDSKVFLLSQLSKHVEEACSKARHYGLSAKKVSFFLKTKEFRYHTCQLVFSSPTNIPEIILPFIENNLPIVHKPNFLYRSAGVTLHDLVSTSVVQADLFGDTVRASRLELVHKQIDDLEEKFGRQVVYLASSQNALKRKVKGKDFHNPDRNLLFL